MPRAWLALREQTNSIGLSRCTVPAVWVDIGCGAEPCRHTYTHVQMLACCVLFIPTSAFTTSSPLNCPAAVASAQVTVITTGEASGCGTASSSATAGGPSSTLSIPFVRRTIIHGNHTAVYYDDDLVTTKAADTGSTAGKRTRRGCHWSSRGRAAFNPQSHSTSSLQ